MRSPYSPSMQCALLRCGAPAALVCANCGSAAYCGKEHQREHWVQHKAQCFPCAVRSSDQLGRFLSTSRPVDAGTLLISEWPLVVGPRPGPALCLGCHCPLVSTARAYKCGACGAPVCDAQCEKLAAHSQWECKQLVPDRGGALRLQPELVLPLRCLVGVRSGQADWKAFLELESHLEKRRAAAVWDERQRQIVDVLRAHGVVAQDGTEDELVQRICGILDVNSFEVRGPAAVGHLTGEPLRAVFLRAAMMAHSCLPNCQLAVDDNLKLTVRASCPLARATPVHYNYCELLQSTAKRQDHLREGKYFECACARCSDPSEGGTHLSSLWCPHCLSGLVVPPPLATDDADKPDKPVQPLGPPGRALKPLPSGVLALPVSCTQGKGRPAGKSTPEQSSPAKPSASGKPRGKSSARKPSPAESLPGKEVSSAGWRCTHCRRFVSSRAAHSALSRCAEAWEVVRSGCDDEAVDGVDARSLEALLARLSRTLPPRHALQLGVKQLLVAMYHDAVVGARRPAAHALSRMRELCQEILDVLEKLLPGKLSRLKGIALHELHLAVALGGDGSDLPQARSLLQASLRHLQLEPSDSPEGRLYHLALQELAAIDESIRQDLYEHDASPRMPAPRSRRRGKNK